MKRVTTKWLFLALVVALGCSKDNPKPSLIGTWKEGRTIFGCPDGSFDKTTCTGNCNVVVTATTLTDTDQTIYTYTVSGSTITFKSTVATYIYTFELTAGTFTIAQTQSNGCVSTTYYTKV